MSTDNWTQCPRCLSKANDERAKQRAKTAAAYGKVPVEKYLEMREQSSKEVALDISFREDYQIGVDDDGTFEVDYSGGCHVCGLTFEYKYTERVRTTS